MDPGGRGRTAPRVPTTAEEWIWVARTRLGPGRGTIPPTVWVEFRLLALLALAVIPADRMMDGAGEMPSGDQEKLPVVGWGVPWDPPRSWRTQQEQGAPRAPGSRAVGSPVMGAGTLGMVLQK